MIPYGDDGSQNMQLQQELQRRRQMGQMGVNPTNFNPDAQGVNGFAPSAPMEMQNDFGGDIRNNWGTGSGGMNMGQGQAIDPEMNRVAHERNLQQNARMQAMQSMPQHMQAMNQRLMANRQGNMGGIQNSLAMNRANPQNAMGQGAPPMGPYKDLQGMNQNQMAMNRGQMMGERPAQALPVRPMPAQAQGLARGRANGMGTGLATGLNKATELAKTAKSGINAIKSKSKPKAPAAKAKPANKSGAMLQEPPTF